MKEFLYHLLADDMRQLIIGGTLRKGDKLPSLRMLAREKGLSLMTVYHAVLELESQGLVESRPKSGYYVCYNPAEARLPAKRTAAELTEVHNTDELVKMVYSDLGERKVQFSLNMPSIELLPVQRFKRSVLETVRSKTNESMQYGPIAGIARLRQQIARSAFAGGARVAADDVIVTAGCMEAINLAIRAVTKAGDHILIESPVYFGIFQAILSLGRIPVELPVDPVYGMAVSDVRKAVETQEIRACLIITSFSNPTGSLLPDEAKKDLVELLDGHNIVLIENDLYGDLYFGKERPRTCKSFDRTGNVVLCSSYSKTLAPGYRIGWILPGKFYDEVFGAKINQVVTTPVLTQEIVAQYLEKGRYDLHLKRLRRELYLQSLRFVQAVHDYFPSGTRVTRPSGGFVLWVEFPETIDSLDLFNAAAKENIRIAPGQLFSAERDYHNFMRLSIGQRYTAEIDGALRTLGAIAGRLDAQKAAEKVLQKN